MYFGAISNSISIIMAWLCGFLTTRTQKFILGCFGCTITFLNHSQLNQPSRKHIFLLMCFQFCQMLMSLQTAVVMHIRGDKNKQTISQVKASVD